MKSCFYISAFCFGLLLQMPTDVDAQEFYFDLDDGNLNAQASAWSNYFGNGNINNEGPYTSQISAGTNFQDADAFVSQNLLNSGSAGLSPNGQSLVAIAAISQAAHSQFDDTNGMMGGCTCTHAFFGDAAWTFESDIYGPGQGDPFISGEVNVSWGRAGNGTIDTSGGQWTVNWNGSPVIDVQLYAEVGAITVDYSGAGTPDVFFIDVDADSYSFPFVIPNPDVGDTLLIQFNSTLILRELTGDSVGNASLDWKVELEAIDL